MPLFITNDSEAEKLHVLYSQSVRCFTLCSVLYGAVICALLLLSSCQSAVRFSSSAKEISSPTSGIVSSSRVKSRANSTAVSTAPNNASSTPLNVWQHGIVESAERWLGTPYRYGAMGRDGTDCSGFVMRVYEEQGIAVPRSTKDQFVSGTWIDAADLLVGDLLFFNTNGTGVSHVGIYVGSDSIIHASSKSGVVRQSFSDTYLAKTFMGARRILREGAD